MTTTRRLVMALSALLCLGGLGYVAYVGWARKQARVYWDTMLANPQPLSRQLDGHARLHQHLRDWASTWERCPWHGEFSGDWVPWHRNRPGYWLPKRQFYETLQLMIALPIPEDAGAFARWLDEHPNLVWDDTLKRVVEPPT